MKKNKAINVNSLEYIHNKLSNYEKMPKYINKLFYDLEQEIKKCNKNRFQIDILDNEEQFLDKMIQYLNQVIEQYLKLNIDEYNDF